MQKILLVLVIIFVGLTLVNSVVIFSNVLPHLKTEKQQVELNNDLYEVISFGDGLCLCKINKRTGETWFYMQERYSDVFKDSYWRKK